MKDRLFAIIILIGVLADTSSAQHSVAREWNEALLAAIRKDFARPTVHAHNLFHSAIAMYDAWVAFDAVGETYLLGKTVGTYTCPYNGISYLGDLRSAREEAISYAEYRLLKHRFRYSPGDTISLPRFDSLMTALGYDTSFTSTDYSNGSPAALGNYIAQNLINFGLQDGSNEAYDYGNLHYQPVNPPLDPTKYGNSTVADPNRWQPLTLGTFIDQSGNHIPIHTPEFLGAEWGAVTPFALTGEDRYTYTRGGYDYQVYNDPGPPPYLDTLHPGGELTEAYKWAFELVSAWSSHLDPTDGIMWDISPATIGNIQQFPQTLAEMRDFYDFQRGGDPGLGRTMNPRTGQPYQPQIVPRGDYARVLAEFWADGPNSETPPGHWFTILNYVNDYPGFAKRFRGEGPVLDDLEWDVKAYFILGGAVHDAAIAAWGVKGWYDYIRPISAIRLMADRGQSTDPALPHYSPAGVLLVPGLVELVQPGDPLAGLNNVNVGRIKVFAWRGHSYVINPSTSVAGVGWILAGNWWPYQRPTFVTPPFAGYVSGHSTFSRAAAEVLTLLTGDEYFPGGMGEFHAPRNQYLVFEDGPSVDVTLQWATYRDAADQCALSRIWGGIHPPVDDMPGRLIGKEIGPAAFLLAEKYFLGKITAGGKIPAMWQLEQNYPNPFNGTTSISFGVPLPSFVSLKVFDVAGKEVTTILSENMPAGRYIRQWNAREVASGVYFYRLQTSGYDQTRKLMLIR
jgi:Domain of unknown function (DUF6851)/Secretion system C-terminal sorting domain